MLTRNRKKHAVNEIKLEDVAPKPVVELEDMNNFLPGAVDPRGLCECVLNTSDTLPENTDEPTVSSDKKEEIILSDDVKAETTDSIRNELPEVVKRELMVSQHVEAVVRPLEDENHNLHVKKEQIPIMQQVLEPKRVLRVLLRRLEDEDLTKLLNKRVQRSLSTPLKYNASNHSSLKIFCCNICSKTYASLLKLSFHRHGKCPLLKCIACEICEESILVTHRLKHMALHGIKDFLCEICGKQFRRKYNLKNHLRNHFDETPFPCKKCKKHFKTKRRQKKHFCSKRKLFTCNNCKNSFHRLHSLDIHMKKAFRYKCKACKKQLCSRYFLKKHSEEHLQKDVYFEQGEYKQRAENFNLMTDCFQIESKHLGPQQELLQRPLQSFNRDNRWSGHYIR